MDAHIHFICPQQVQDAIASGITTMLGGGTGPAAGTSATTCTPGPWHMMRILQAAEAFPVNLGFVGKGNASRPAPLEARAGVPAPMAPLLLDPPLALLRVPSPPTDSAARHFTAGIEHPVAIRWLPPDIVPPAPWDPEHPWAAPSGFPLPVVPGNAIQKNLFEDLAD